MNNNTFNQFKILLVKWDYRIPKFSINYGHSQQKSQAKILKYC